MEPTTKSSLADSKNSTSNPTSIKNKNQQPINRGKIIQIPYNISFTVSSIELQLLGIPPPKKSKKFNPYSKKKNHTIRTDSEMSHMLKLVVKDFKRTSINKSKYQRKYGHKE